ncbi:MAG TPA: hypothetical protein VFK02_30380 [Kofleriaceae bacterium]|nr:hypothetical protein [Kofleriaceae bacterium]
MKRALALVIGIGCAGPEVTPPATPATPSSQADAAALSSPLVSEIDDLPEAPDVADRPDVQDPTDVPRVADMPPAPEPISELSSSELGESTRIEDGLAMSEVPGPEIWLKGSTHVHARASGDSSEPNQSVISWYEQHHYDFIVLTDHNRVSELEPGASTLGQVTLRDPSHGLIVFSGIELTHNPVGCVPIGDRSRNCRIHVNLLGPTARPGGRIEWAERHSHLRLDMYGAAGVAQTRLGGLAQINHPQWLWGMTPDLLVELSHRGMRLVEIANAAFTRWNAGDAAHPSTEALWDAALARGAIVWGTASDDAHDYTGHGKYPPGGGWVVVRARREPRAILDALAAGRFYSSNGVVLERAEVEGGELLVAVDPAQGGRYSIEFIENGRHVRTIAGKVGRRALPAFGYLRAVVTRDDGKRAWVQPVRR